MISFADKCSIPLFIKTSKFQALLDTGASISAINATVLKKLPGNCYKIRNSDIAFITVAGGSSHQVEGKVDLEIKVGGLIISHIIDNLCRSVILGTDFMKQQNACLDWRTHMLYLQDFSTHVGIIKVDYGFARMSRSLLIQPGSVVNVPVKLSRTNKNTTVLLEPLNNQNKTGLAFAKCVVKNRPSMFTCRCLKLKTIHKCSLPL